MSNITIPIDKKNDINYIKNMISQYISDIENKKIIRNRIIGKSDNINLYEIVYADCKYVYTVGFMDETIHGTCELCNKYDINYHINKNSIFNMLKMKNKELIESNGFLCVPIVYRYFISDKIYDEKARNDFRILKSGPCDDAFSACEKMLVKMRENNIDEYYLSMVQVMVSEMYLLGLNNKGVDTKSVSNNK